MASDTMQTDIEKIRAAKAEYRKLIQSIGTNALKEACQDVMDKTGGTKVRWHQYTPYFNDGDPCVFGASDAYVFIPGPDRDPSVPYDVDDEDEEEEEVSSGPGWRGSWSFDYEWVRDDEGRAKEKIWHDEGGKALEELSKILNELEEVLLECFDDHKEIIYNGEAFEVEDYNHD